MQRQGALLTRFACVVGCGGGFHPRKNIGNPSVYLWVSNPLGGTGAHGDRVPLLLATEAMLGVFV